MARKVKPDQKNHKEGLAVKEERKSIQKENGVYAQYHKSKQDREKKIGRKNGTVGSVASVGAKATLDQMEGGNEVYESYIVARNLSRPVESATDIRKINGDAVLTEPDAGEILINGFPVQKYDVDNLRKKISCFFQNSCNFSFSIKENVRISQIHKSGKKAENDQERAQRMSGVDELLAQLPAGENTFLTGMYEENGIELSGGQNQKVALARMFYRDASVLVLDEPSAALDPKAEYELFQTLHKECDNQSMLFVSHRLSNVFLADEIIVMENGCVQAQGTHEELLEKCELYQRLYHYQADKYVVKGEHESSSN